MGKREKIIYIYLQYSSFVELDIVSLSADYYVIHENLPWLQKRYFICLLRQLYFLLKHIFTTKYIIISFAGPHSVLPTFFSKLFSRRSFIILNGSDSVGIKELDYGSLLNYKVRFAIRISFHLVTELWPVSDGLIDGTSDFYINGLKYGFKHYFSFSHLKYYTIQNGFDINQWNVNRTFNSFEHLKYLSVISGESQFELKGIDLLVSLIAVRPEIKITIVGMNKPNIDFIPENIIFLGYISQDELKKLFAEHNVYFQLSSFEGFGCSLSEAMASGLIPIGSDVNEIPIIIGKSGYILRKKNIYELNDLISRIEFASVSERLIMSQAARERIQKCYSIQIRMDLIHSRLEVYK